MGTTLDNLIAKKNDIMAEIRAKGAEALKETFKEFFDTHPDCAALRWSQYAPYFNDGEPCQFSVNDFRVKMTASPEDAGDDEDGFEDTWIWEGHSQKDNEAFKTVAQAVKSLQRIDDELFELAFGDHSEVTATRDGFEVEEYEHE